jgi:hypothetical protein
LDINRVLGYDRCFIKIYFSSDVVASAVLAVNGVVVEPTGDEVPFVPPVPRQPVTGGPSLLWDGGPRPPGYLGLTVPVTFDQVRSLAKRKIEERIGRGIMGAFNVSIWEPLPRYTQSDPWTDQVRAVMSELYPTVPYSLFWY